jgi:hypothetical protein
MRFVPLAIQMLLLIAPLHAEDPLSALAGPENALRLRGGGFVSSSVPSSGALSLVPAVSSRAELAAELGMGQISAGVEYARLLPMPAGAGAEVPWVEIFNVMHAVSTMQGITYYSASHGKDRVLFTESWPVASPTDTTRISDPLFTDVPRDDTLYTVQNDSSFGRNTYRDTFSFRGDHLLVKVENVSAISFLFVPLIQPGGFVSRIVLIPAGDKLLFYGVSWVRTGMLIGDRKSREDSLRNRVVAMSRWLETRLVESGR